MAKETIVTSCPRGLSNVVISFYECYGWELVSNNVVAAVTTTTANVATDCELTFSREKNTPWYSRVCELSSEYYACDDKVKEINNTYPVSKIKYFVISFIFCFIIFSGLATSLEKDGFMWIPFFAFVALIVSIVKYSVSKREWHKKNDRLIRELEDRKVAVTQESKRLVNS